MPHLELEDGFRLYYERHGEGSPILFAHGAGGNSMSWWQQVPAFMKRYTVITFDHRAFGRSPDIQNGPGRTAFGPDVVALITALDLGPVHFIAHSMGARTAMGLMRHNPTWIRSLTLSGSNAGCVDEQLRARKIELQASGALQGTLLQRALAENFREHNPALAGLYHRIRSINPSRPRDFLAPPPEMRNYRGSTRDRIIESDIPLLWIVGELDRVIPAELVMMSHKLTPGSRYLQIPNAGHSAYFENASAWNNAVLTFVDEVEAN